MGEMAMDTEQRLTLDAEFDEPDIGAQLMVSTSIMGAHGDNFDAAVNRDQDREEQCRKEDNFGLIAELWDRISGRRAWNRGQVLIFSGRCSDYDVPAKDRQNRHGAAESRQFCGLGGICCLRGGDCDGKC